MKAKTKKTTLLRYESLEAKQLLAGDLALVDDWAFEETFDGDPTAPSQALLPTSFDYSVTHRTHPKEHFTKQFPKFPADHAEDCAGPSPDVTPLPQHDVTTSNNSNGENPDEAFFICKNHMMSAMGHVEGYSVASFWPRQEFNFAEGGILEFDVNINGNHPRVWWEVIITPREQLRPNAAISHAPISEGYSPDHIVLQLNAQGQRRILVGSGTGDDTEGNLVDSKDWRNWAFSHPNDPALEDRRIRRTMQVELHEDAISWRIKDENGEWDTYEAEVPGGLPFDEGLVVFKTHAYTPEKDGNLDNYTFHWDNLRFSGPDNGLYPVYESNDTVYLQRNGNRPIGDQATTTITLPEDIGDNPLLFGQTHNGMPGQVLVSINDGPMQEIPVTTSSPYGREGWRAFHLPLDTSQLVSGENTITFEVGPRPDGAVDWAWDGFSIKDLEIQTEPLSSVAPPNVIEGDVNRDSKLDSADVDYIFELIRQNRYEQVADLNEDSQVDQADVDILLEDHLDTRRGDADLNGTIDFADVLILLQSFGRPGGWANGDFDGSGEIDFDDVVILIIQLR